MSDTDNELSGPDLAAGVDLSHLAGNDLFLGHAHGENILIARKGTELFAISATCTHYGGPLAEGLVVGDTVRCPWHHACFSLRTGAMLRAPALDGVNCWQVEERDGKVYVGKQLNSPGRRAAPVASTGPRAIVIIGGGAAGNAAAEALRNEGFEGSITLLSADNALPYDRPNLSKGFLGGTIPEEYVPLRNEEFYRDRQIDVRLNTRVEKIDVLHKKVLIQGGESLSFDRLLLALGAQPIRLNIPGADLPFVHYLRTRSDADALVELAQVGKKCVVLGASFIGMEVTASLRAREVEVSIVAPGNAPMEKVLGAEVGNYLRSVHEEHGVKFHMGTRAASLSDGLVTLENGEKLPADFVLAGIGVRPTLDLAAAAGLAMDRGVTVDAFLETSATGIFAAGDIARWPDKSSGQNIRVEHWVVAERQGQVAALNMLGGCVAFDAVPFFWSEQYDLALSYVGHAEEFDAAHVEGDLAGRDCTITYCLGGNKLAVASLGRDLESLRAEVELDEFRQGERRAACVK